VGADEVGEALMAERERDDHAIGRDAAPALREVPEREEEAVVDALVVHDGERDREVVRAAGPTVEELHAQLGPGHDPLDEAVVEHRQAGRLEHHPADLRADVRAFVVPAPRPHDVAVAEQLAAAAAEDLDGPGEEALDDQEPAMVAVGLDRRGGVPLAGGEPLHAREGVAARPLEIGRGEELAEVRIGLDDADGRVAHVASIPGTAMSARGRRRPDAPTPGASRCS
jgi:hypothetical protein